MNQMQQQGDDDEPDKDEDDGDLGHKDKLPGDDLADEPADENEEADVIPLADPDPDPEVP